jgi:RHS repeat-associated protein
VTESTGSADRIDWPLVDHLGTVRDLAKNDGTLGEHYEYDSYGNVVSGDTSKTRYLFTSREFDEDTGLQYNRARWYDAAVGRWVSEDPIGFAAGDANLARYVGNASTIVVDPTGLDETPALQTDQANYLIAQVPNGDQSGPQYGQPRPQSGSSTPKPILPIVSGPDIPFQLSGEKPTAITPGTVWLMILDRPKEDPLVYLIPPIELPPVILGRPTVMQLAEEMIDDPSLARPSLIDMIVESSNRPSASPPVSKPAFSPQGMTINFNAGAWSGTLAVRPLGQNLLELNIVPAGGIPRPVPPEVIFNVNPLDRPGSAINANPLDFSDPAGRPLTVSQVGKTIVVDIFLGPIWEAHKEDFNDIKDEVQYQVHELFK